MKPTAEIARPLPASEASEKVLLGVLLVNPKVRADLLDRVQPEDFFLASNRAIWEAVRNLRDKRREPDVLGVSEELERTGKLEAAGGYEYLASLMDGIPGALETQSHVSRIADKATLRAILYAANEIEESVFSGADPQEVLDGALGKFSDIARTRLESEDNGTSYRDAATQLLRSFEEQSGIRVFSDVEELDRLTGGFRAGELVVVTAETGTGKTLLSQQIRRRACRDGFHVLFASGEMSAPHLLSRELAAQAEVQPWKMRRPERIDRKEFARLVTAASRECKQCAVLDGELSIERIRMAARRMKRRGLGLVVLDYDELITSRGDTEFEQQQSLARSSKSLAIELQVPVVLVSQLRKTSGDNKREDSSRPTLSRLYGSGAKVKHASLVIFVDRPFVRNLTGDETAARIVVMKNRNGSVGRIDAKFDVRQLRFSSAPREQKADVLRPDVKARSAGETIQ